MFGSIVLLINNPVPSQSYISLYSKISSTCRITPCSSEASKYWFILSPAADILLVLPYIATCYL